MLSRFHADLRSFLQRKWLHALYRARTYNALIWWFLYTTPIANGLRRLSNLVHRRPRTRHRIALVAHVFYPDLLSEILGCFRHLPADAELLITAPDEQMRAIRSMIPSDVPAILIPCENRGRDIGPLLMLLNAGQLEAYDLVLKLHTKRSLHVQEGTLHRKMMFASLAGSYQRVAAILSFFAARKDAGLLGCKAVWCTHKRYWQRDRERTNALAERMNAKARLYPCFFRGSMFWFRPIALERLRKLAIQADDFESEDGQTDSTLHHAIERVFSMTAAADGFRTLDVEGKILF
jgi:rhamnosyltransferase